MYVSMYKHLGSTETRRRMKTCTIWVLLVILSGGGNSSVALQGSGHEQGLQFSSVGWLDRLSSTPPKAVAVPWISWMLWPVTGTRHTLCLSICARSLASIRLHMIIGSPTLYNGTSETRWSIGCSLPIGSNNLYDYNWPSGADVKDDGGVPPLMSSFRSEVPADAAGFPQVPCPGRFEEPGNL